MKFTRHDGGFTLEGRRTIYRFDCDWPQFWRFSDWNWLSVCLLDLTPEWNRSLGSVEITAGVLGFRFYASYTYNTATPQREGLRASMDDWLAGTFISVPHAEYAAMKAGHEKWLALEAAAPVESLGREHG